MIHMDTQRTEITLQLALYKNISILAQDDTSSLFHIRTDV